MRVSAPSNNYRQKHRKRLAQLDGAFLVVDDGIILSATGYIDASSEGIDLPIGLDSRHMATASVTKWTDSVAVVDSERSIVRVFDDGEIVSEIISELWLFRYHRYHLEGPISTRTSENMTVICKKSSLKGGIIGLKNTNR